MEKKIKDLVKYAQSIGLEHFALLISAGPMSTFHYQDMKMKDLVNLMIGGFLNVIQREVDSHPEYSPARKALYGSLQADFAALIKSYDGKIMELIAKEGKGK